MLIFVLKKADPTAHEILVGTSPKTLDRLMTKKAVKKELLN